jgi:mannose-6-phosphate isomerase-like protein (cupin superfamily)
MNDSPGQSAASNAPSEANQMSASKVFPYVTNLDIKYSPLEVVDEKAIADACEHRWFNQSLCEVNNAVVRLGVVQGEYHWHKHTGDDEFFYVLEGKLFIDVEGGRTFELGPRQGVVIPKNTLHRPRAPERTVMLMVENAGVVPTGN